jgi:two-component system sensor histidine kinase RstB
MTQLFLRFYLGVLAVLFLAWWIYGYVLQLRYEADRARVVTEAHASGLRLIAEDLRRIPVSDRADAISVVAKEFRCPLEILPLESMASNDRSSLNRPNASSYMRWDQDREGVAVVIDDTTYLRMGPFPNYDLFGIEDSLRGWMRAAAGKLRSAGKPFDQVLADMQSRFNLPLAIDTIDAIPADAAGRMRANRDVVFYSKPHDRFFASTTIEDTGSQGALLTVGPFPKFSREERPAATTTLAIVLLPAALAILMLLRPVAKQLRQIESAAQSIAQGNLQSRVDEQRIGSARNLARAFNQMANRTETMVRTQRELLQAVSHELKTPLARIRFAMDLASTASEDSERSKRLKAIDDAVEDLDGLVEELISYVRMEDASAATRRESVSIREVLDGLLERHRAIHPGKEFSWNPTSISDAIHVLADPTALHRALGNLIGNAARFANRRVEISASAQGNRVVIDIDDDGPGIPAADRSRVLEPFVRLENQPDPTDNPPGAGVGLGLAIVRRTIEQHAATLEIADSPLGGCRVRTSWPPATTEALPSVVNF